jgi:hypothetical protein
VFNGFSDIARVEDTNNVPADQERLGSVSL